MQHTTAEIVHDNDSSYSLPILKRHSYPFIVKFFCGFAQALFLVVITHFLSIELPCLLKIKRRVDRADLLFKYEEYMLAGALYNDIYKEYPQCRKAHLRIIQSYFALISEDEKFYWLGLSYIVGKEFKNSEIKEIENFLPESYRAEFRSFFKFHSFSRR
jgi:hypothetical protein